jgi:hypothetical protein
MRVCGSSRACSSDARSREATEELAGKAIQGAHSELCIRDRTHARRSFSVLVSLLLLSFSVNSRDLPRIVEKNERHSLIVDDAPYLILGAQVNNSSAWPAALPKVWPAVDGVTYGYERNAFSRISMQYDDASGELLVGTRNGSYEGMPQTRTLNVRLITPGEANAANLDTAPDATLEYSGQPIRFKRETAQ